MVRSPNEPPLQAQNALAVAIAGSSLTRDKRQRHVAMLLRSRGKELRLLHLAWHRTLVYEEWPATDYHWIEIAGLDPDLQELLVDWFEIVAAAGNDGIAPIPYSAFFNPAGNFDSHGHFLDRNDGTGLTCATFILALFADFQLPLIEPSTWPQRPHDLVWLTNILNRLRPVIGELQFLQQLAMRNALKRYRPEEIFAAASIFSGSVLSFDDVDGQVQMQGQAMPQ